MKQDEKDESEGEMNKGEIIRLMPDLLDFENKRSLFKLELEKIQIIHFGEPR